MKKSFLFCLVIVAAFCIFFKYGRSIWVPAYYAIADTRTVDDVIQSYGSSARARLRPYFQAVDVAYPPKQVTFLVTKDTAQLELWVGRQPKYVRTYKIQALSGVAGPKLREGDRQVPEGIYEIESFNPNSSYHLSMKLNYPNQFDLKHAKLEGRDNPGSNIFIHGKAVSIGCLAMGDEAIEELFVLVSDVRRQNVKVIIAPYDPRKRKLVSNDQREWIKELYMGIEKEFIEYNHNP